MMDNPSSRQPRSLMSSFASTTTIPNVLFTKDNMMQSQTQAIGQSDILAEFKHKLEHDWKRTNFEGKHFYVRDDIYQWMKTGEPANVVRLLVRVNQKIRGGKFPEIESSDLFNPMSLIVFAILLSLDYGHLIQIFHKHNITDDRLDLTIEEGKDLHQAISEDLAYERIAPAKVFSAFEERKWAFMPVPFKLLMHDHFKGVNWVLPFAKRRKVAEGGTATIYQVLVHEDLLAQDFRYALRDGKQNHESLRGYYEFAIKEYTKVNEADYKRECQAFRAIRGQEGMVQFLGQFVYDKKDAKGRRETIYNILLEFGEFDLDEFFGEQQQYPPVLQLEIVLFWQSFFKVADAISRVHNLEVKAEDGARKVYRGWHADIKPENILRVYGEFKLADFGFAKFSDFNWDGQIPTSFIHGGTAAYGAPETDIRRQLRGTLTPVSQTIDTWSFGCVLSITATWVVLGVQGVYQYQQVRKVAISKLDERQKPSSQDAFHDGNDVLPEIQQWHQYLRASMRKCDPITDKILDLIERRMLVASPTDRIQCKDLCEKLDSFLDDARRACDRPEMSITQDIMTTLLDFDRKAPSSATEAREIKAEQELRDNVVDDDIDHEALRRRLAPPNETLRVKSKRFSKPDRQVIVQGKFAHRTLALESALRRSGHSSAPREGNKEKAREHDGTQHSSRVDAPPPIAPSPTPSSLYDDPQPPGAVEDTFIKRSVEPDQLSSSSSASRPAWQNHEDAQWGGGEPRPDALSRNTTPPPILLTEEPGDMTPRVVPKENEYHTSPAPDLLNHGPLNILQSYEGSEPSATPRPNQSDRAQTAMGSSSTPTIPIVVPKACPQGISPYHHLEHCEEAICKERIRLDMARKNTGISGFLRKPKKDEMLKDLISNRDFIFVVDRAPTMLSCWEWATFLVETLAMKLARLDDDGLDLVFTSGNDYDLKGVKDATKFKTAMENALPSPKSPKTDMSRCLGELSRPYLSSFRNKKLTLIIVTDGMWGLAGSAARENPVDKKIANFIKDLTGRAGSSTVEDRWFSIQFISFATDPQAQAYLDYLDTNLSKDHKIPDVIDTKPWHHKKVHNLILGSLDPYADEAPDGEGEGPATQASIGYNYAGPSAPPSQSLSPTPRSMARSPSGRETELSRSGSTRKSGLLGRIKKT